MRSLHRRIVLVASLFVLLVTALCSFFALRITMEQAQGNALEQLRSTVQVASSVAGDSQILTRIAKLMGVRITIMEASGAPVSDTSGVMGYFLDQPDVIIALNRGLGQEIFYEGGFGNMQVAMSKKLDNGNILRAVHKSDVFKHGSWSLYWLMILLVLGVGVGVSFAMARKVVRPIGEISSAAKAIMNGNYNVNLRIFGYSELAGLLRTLKAMNSHLQDTVEALQHKSAELESIISHMIHGMIAVDGQLRVVQMNNAAKRLLGVSGSTEGKHVLEATGNTKLEAFLLEAMSQVGLITVELPVRAAPRHRVVRLYVSPLEHEDESIGAVVLMEDITEFRNLEQMRADFAANVTHELRTPLTSIRGFVETLQGGAVEDPELAKRFLEIISVETDRLSRLIDDILSLSSMEAGRVLKATQRLDVGKEVEEVCEFLSDRARASDITLTCQAQKDVCINANIDHVKQVLLNLIENAIKYTLAGGTVLVFVEREGEQVVFRVQDTGIGIEGAHIPRLFERFYRVDKGRSRNMGGTGLGLAIVKHIVMEMGGNIDVKSKIGQGSEFIVTLPYAEPSQEG